MTDKGQVVALKAQLLDKLKQAGLFRAEGVRAAFDAVPRHLFLPHLSLEEAYEDKAVGIKHDKSGLLTSSASQPTMMAIMLNQLGLKDGDNVLEIGTATGYNAALMGHIVGQTGRVTTIEIDNSLAKQAKRNLQNAHMNRVTVVNADGAQGYAPRAAYDHIVATVGVWDIPNTWLSQLKPNGSIVVPIVIDGVQMSAKFKPLSDGSYISFDNRPCSFVYMLGDNAGPSYRRQVGSTSMYLLADQVEEIDTAALHLLLSDDHQYCHFDTPLEASDYYNGYQLYLMLNEPDDHIFAAYAVIDGQKAYGVEGRGIALFARGSAALADYQGRTLVHCFAGSDAFIEMQRVLDDWNALGQPTQRKMRLRLTPRGLGKPQIERGKLFERNDNYLHAWIDADAPDQED